MSISDKRNHSEKSAMTFAVTFNRTINGVTSAVTTFSTAGTAAGAIYEARIRARRADRLCGEAADHSDFVASPARKVLA